MTDHATTEQLERLQKEVSQLREFVIMQTAILQCIAVKMGIAPQNMDAFSPTPIPTPFDLMDMLKPKG